MAIIIRKKDKKVIALTETELCGLTHINHVINALSAFADEKVTFIDTNMETTSHTFRYNKYIPTKVLEGALHKLQVNLEK